jgi:hypothetical protein
MAKRQAKERESLRRGRSPANSKASIWRRKCPFRRQTLPILFTTPPRNGFLSRPNVVTEATFALCTEPTCQSAANRAARLFRCQSRTFVNSSEEKSSGLAPSTPSSKHVPWGEKICFRRPIIEPQLQIEGPRSPVEEKRLHRLSAGAGPLRVHCSATVELSHYVQPADSVPETAARRVASRALGLSRRS